MAYFDNINTEHCPNCNVKLGEDGENEFITNDSRCSSCGAPLKIVSHAIASFNEAPYTIYAIEIDKSRGRR